MGSRHQRKSGHSCWWCSSALGRQYTPCFLTIRPCCVLGERELGCYHLDILAQDHLLAATSMLLDISLLLLKLVASLDGSCIFCSDGVNSLLGHLAKFLNFEEVAEGLKEVALNDLCEDVADEGFDGEL